MLTSRSLPQQMEQISPLTPGQWRRGLRVSQIGHFMTGGLGDSIVTLGQGALRPVFESSDFRDGKSQRRYAEGGNRRVWPGPLKEGLCRRVDKIVNSGRVVEISFFVNGIAVKVENPGFYIPPWNKMSDSFFGGARRSSF